MEFIPPERYSLVIPETPPEGSSTSPGVGRPQHVDSKLQALLDTGMANSVLGTGGLRNNEDALGLQKFKEGQRRIYVNPEVFEMLNKAAQEIDAFEHAVEAEVQASGSGPPKGFDALAVGTADQGQKKPKKRWGTFAMLTQLRKRDPNLPNLPGLSIPDMDDEWDVSPRGDMGNVAMGLHGPHGGDLLGSPGQARSARFASRDKANSPQKTKRGGGWQDTLRTKREEAERKAAEAAAAAATAAAAAAAAETARLAELEAQQSVMAASQETAEAAEEADMFEDLHDVPMAPPQPPRPSNFNFDLNLARISMAGWSNELPQDPDPANPDSTARGKSIIREKPIYVDTEALELTAREEAERRRKELEQEELTNRDSIADQLAAFQRDKGREKPSKSGVAFAEELEKVQTISPKHSSKRSPKHHRSPKQSVQPPKLTETEEDYDSSMQRRRALLNLDSNDDDEDTEGDDPEEEAGVGPRASGSSSVRSRLSGSISVNSHKSFSLNPGSPAPSFTGAPSSLWRSDSHAWGTHGDVHPFAVRPDPDAPGEPVLAAEGGAVRTWGVISAPPDDRIQYGDHNLSPQLTGSAHETSPTGGRLSTDAVARLKSVGFPQASYGPELLRSQSAEQLWSGQELEHAASGPLSHRSQNGQSRGGRLYLRNAMDLYASRPPMSFTEFRQLREWRPAGGISFRPADPVYQWMPPDTDPPQALVRKRSHSSMGFALKSEWKAGGQGPGVFSPLKYEPCPFPEVSPRRRPGSATLLGRMAPLWRPAGVQASSLADVYAYLRAPLPPIPTIKLKPTEAPRDKGSQWRPSGFGSGAFNPRPASLTGTDPSNQHFARHLKTREGLYGPWKEPGQAVKHYEKTLDWGPYVPLRDNVFARSDKVLPPPPPSRHVGPAQLNTDRISRLRQVTQALPKGFRRRPLVHADVYEEVEPVVLTETKLQGAQGRALHAAVVTYRLSTDRCVVGRALRVMWDHLTQSRPSTSHYLEIPIPEAGACGQRLPQEAQGTYRPQQNVASQAAIAAAVTVARHALPTELSWGSLGGASSMCTVSVKSPTRDPGRAYHKQVRRHTLKPGARPELLVIPRADHPALMKAIRTKTQRHAQRAAQRAFHAQAAPPAAPTNSTTSAQHTRDARHAPLYRLLREGSEESAETVDGDRPDGYQALSLQLALAIDRSMSSLPSPTRAKADSSSTTSLLQCSAEGGEGDRSDSDQEWVEPGRAVAQERLMTPAPVVAERTLSTPLHAAATAAAEAAARTAHQQAAARTRVLPRLSLSPRTKAPHVPEAGPCPARPAATMSCPVSPARATLQPLPQACAASLAEVLPAAKLVSVLTDLGPTLQCKLQKRLLQIRPKPAANDLQQGYEGPVDQNLGVMLERPGDSEAGVRDYSGPSFRAKKCVGPASSREFTFPAAAAVSAGPLPSKARAPACMPLHLLPIPFTSQHARDRVQQHMMALPLLPRLLAHIDRPGALASFPRPWSQERMVRYLLEHLDPEGLQASDSDVAQALDLRHLQALKSAGRIAGIMEARDSQGAIDSPMVPKPDYLTECSGTHLLLDASGGAKLPHFAALGQHATMMSASGRIPGSFGRAGPTSPWAAYSSLDEGSFLRSETKHTANLEVRPPPAAPTQQVVTHPLGDAWLPWRLRAQIGVSATHGV